MRHPNVPTTGNVSVPTISLLSLLAACAPESVDQTAQGECQGPDCDTVVQVHEVTSSSSVEVTEAHPTAATIADVGIDATDTVYVGDGSTYGLLSIPYYEGDGGRLLDGGNATVTATTLSTTASSVTVEFSVTDTGNETISVDAAGSDFDISGSDLTFDDDGSAGTADVTIGSITAGESSGTYTWEVAFNYGSLTTAIVDDLIQALTYNHIGTTLGADFTQGNRTINVEWDEDGTGSGSRDDMDVVVKVTDDPQAIPSQIAIAFSEGGSGVSIDGSVSIDAESSLASLTSGITVSISSGAQGSTDSSDPEDVLSIGTTGVAAYGTVTATETDNHTITLTAGTSLSDYESALQDITYTNSAGDATTGGTRDISISIDNGTAVAVLYELTVTADEDAPVFSSSDTITVDENTTAVVTAAADDPDETGTISYSISGTDSADFSINSSTGVLEFSSAPDFESPDDDDTDNVYELTITADDGTSTTDQAITVTVDDVNDNSPVISTSGSQSVDEGTTTVVTIAATDADAIDTITYSISSGTDAADFSINSSTGALSFASTPDYESPDDDDTDNSYSVEVEASDGTNSDTLSLTVTVNDLNEDPTAFSASTDTVSFDENDTSAVGTYTATDSDGTASISYSISGTDSGDFSINSSTGELTFSSTPDYESPDDDDTDNSYSVTVTATDATSSDTDTIDVTVNVNDLDDNPTEFSAATDTVSFDENDTSAVGTYTATDNDGTASISYSISGTDSGDFSINSSTGELTFSSTPDYESPDDADTDNSYSVTVTATDATSSDTDTIDVTVNVNDLDEFATAFSASTDTVSFDENDTSAVGTYTATDNDGTASISYSISGTDSGDFSINSSTGELTFSSTPDYESPDDDDTDNSYSVTVTATDATSSDTDTIDVTVNVNDLDDNPTEFSAATDTVSFDENDTSAVGTYTATDNDGTASISYSISGTDSGDFSINSSTGELTFSSTPDYESPDDADTDNSYSVTVTATDATSSDTDTIDVTVNVNDLDDNPTEFSAATDTVSFDENDTSAVGTYTATDNDGTASLSYSISGTDSGDFSINSSTGELTFSSTPDYESPDDADTDNSYSVTVTATDATSSDTDTIDVTVNVNDLDEFATAFSASTDTVSFDENDTSAVGTYTATDNDGTASISYSIVSTGDSDDFSVNSSTGVLSFASTPDYESPTDSDTDNTYTVTVRATDATSSDTDDVVVTVNVNDLDDNPTEFSAATDTVSYAENDTSAVGTYTATDNDGTSSLSYSISGTDSGDFSINSSTGELTFASSPDYDDPDDADTDNSYSVTVTATDATSSDTDTIAVTVNVTNVNEAPELTVSDFTFDEDTSTTSGAASAVTVADEDENVDGETVTVTLQLSDSDAGTLSSDNATSDSSGLWSYGPVTPTAMNTELGTLDFAPTADYDSDFTIAVTATDDESASDSDTVNVTLDTGNDDAPIVTIDQDPSSPSVGTSVTLTANVEHPDDEDSDLENWTYYWTQTAGSSVGVTGDTTQAVTFTVTSTTALSFQVEVEDDDGETTTETITVTLTNTAPVASAGSDQTVPRGFVVTLDGTGSSDSDGDALTYSWAVDNSNTYPGSSTTYQIADSTASSTTIIVPLDTTATPATGYVTVDLTVDDGTDTNTDSITIYFCQAYFEDDDSDGYGSPDNYGLSCPDEPSYDSSYTGTSTLSLRQDGTSWDGLDCLDDSSSTISGDTQDTDATASSIGDVVDWFEDRDGDDYGDPSVDYDEDECYCEDEYGANCVDPDGASCSPTTAIVEMGSSVTVGSTSYSYRGLSCVTSQPTDSSGYTYVLNDDDCNDKSSTTTTAGETILAAEQNPDTEWFNDVDGDLYASDQATSVRYIVPNSTGDGVCHCQSDCGVTNTCTEYFSDGTSETCTPVSTSTCTIVSKLTQCEDPSSTYTPGSYTTTDANGDSFSLLSNWVLEQGDCDESRSDVNEGETEVCDPADIDEDCNGYADDDEPDASGVGSIFNYYADDDGDGFGDEADVETSCGGSGSSTPRVLYYSYEIEMDTSDADSSYYDDGADCFCPDSTGSDCYDSDGVSCSPNTSSLTEMTDYCYCTEDSCSTICQNPALEACAVDPAGTCTQHEAVDPDWFYEFDQFDCDDSADGDTIYPAAEELCDGQYNDCNDASYSAAGAPDDEVDFDNDDYVACGYVSGWSDSANAPNVGTDCSPNDANVYPNASNVCDGQYNNCANWDSEYADATGACFCADDDTCGSSTYCVDQYGDECTPDTTVSSTSVYRDDSGEGSCFCQDSAGSLLCIDIDSVQCTPSGTLTETDYYFVDDDQDCLCDSTGADCFDLNGFECTATTSTSSLLSDMGCASTGLTMSPGAPTNQTDADGDCYVDCYDTDTVSFTWVGGDALLDINDLRESTLDPDGDGFDDNGDAVESCADVASSAGVDVLDGADCGDSDITVYPGADEVCDGQINDCDDTSLPNDESDDDEDGYVECDYDASTWAGDGSVVGGDDCDDSYELTYPGVSETCDGEFNNCDHPLLEPFTGAAGTGCFCPSSTGGTSSCVLDTDGDGTSEGSCTPADDDSDSTMDDYVALSSTLTIDSSSYETGEVSCYCSATDCEIDVDSDGVSDCITPDGEECTPTDDDGDGYADVCLTDSSNALSLDLDAEGIYSASSAPFDEVDDDNDKYVDCEVDLSVWLGSGLINAGEDCDDTDRYVYPSADELCDGQFNDCDDVDFDIDDVPEDESDDDGDTYVECSYSASVWIGDSSVVDGDDCDDTDADVYPGATEVCDGQYNDCDASDYSSTGSPSDEADDDGDGYTVCGEDIEAIDCDDDDDTTYPDADELCDGLFNDCNSPYTRNFIGAVYEDCFCDSSAGTSCVTSDGSTTCTPTYGELVQQASTSSTPAAPSGYDYISVEGYCPSTSCYIDKDNDGVDDCVLADGSALYEPTDSDRNARADSCVVDALSVSATSDDDTLSITRSTLGQDYSEDAPPEEVDNDGDTFVECTFSSSVWSDDADPFVTGGDDCDDEDNNGEAEYVFPGAEEYCDGVYNDCDDTAYTSISAPDDEVDDDGDGYVDCEQDGLITWKRANTDPERFEDEDGDCFCTVAACSSSTCVDSTGTSCTPTLLTISECIDNEGGYEDCDDEDDAVYPDADELCDGQYNNCNGYDSDGNGSLDEAYDPDGSPDGEIDDDGDGFANCDGFEDSDEYDCDDEDATRFPGAEEICDGQFNDCDHHLIDDFLGAASTGCYCTDPDGDTTSTCTDAIDGTGSSCTPIDDNSDNVIDDFVTGLISGTSTFYSAEVACYCPLADGTIDLDLDGLSDCFTPDGVRCEIDDYDTDNNGIIDNLIEDPLNAGATSSLGTLQIDSPTSFYVGAAAEDNAFTAPPDEYDDDGDRYVECVDYSTSTWEGKSTTVGGSDCDDVNSWAKSVYPGATEFCDGVYNDCDEVVEGDYDDRDPPADESDDDGDGWVECTNDGASWRHPDTNPELYADEDEDCFCDVEDCSDSSAVCLDADGESCSPTLSGITVCLPAAGYEDCDDTDDTVYPTADELCDGQYNDCDASSYSASGAPSDEVDNDGDAYVDCDSDGVTWAGDEEPDGYGDCADDDDTRYPGATEVCDGVFNDCTSSLLLDFAGVQGVDCFCSDTDGEIDTDGDGTSDCLTSDGVTCDPKDLDGDNYMDHFLVTEKSISSIFYYSAEYAAACLCPDSAGEAVDCVDLTGKECTPWSTSSGYMTDFTTLSTPRTIDGTDYYSVEDLESSAGVTWDEEACYCTTSNCLVDDDGNSVSDCYTAGGDLCRISDIDPSDNGVADDCVPTPTGEAGPLDPTDSEAVVFANMTGLDVDDDAPPDEIDDDDDRYVECEYDSTTWQGSEAIPVKGGSDCDDLDDNGEARYVYPGASEYCDGVFNNCNGYDEDGDGEVDEAYSGSAPPSIEVDGDGDGFVDCDPNSGITWKVDSTNPNPLFDIFDTAVYDSSDPYRVYYVDELGTCYCSAQVSEADTTCTGTCVDSTGTTCTPTGSCAPVGGYSDCLEVVADNGAETHPDADELCDGQYNDCRDLSWTEGDPSTWPDRTSTDGTGAYAYVPADERDDDLDTYVECDDFSSTDWLGYSSDVSVTGGDDCDDSDDSVFPNAEDFCDGIFNDCDSPGLATYTGGVSTGCYCPGSDGVIDTDSDDASDCVDLDGVTCEPTDIIINETGKVGSDNIMDTYATMVDAGGVEISKVLYYSSEVSYYCEDSTCVIDPENDGYNDCANGSGERATSTLTQTDASDNCISVAIDTFTFGQRDFFEDFDRDRDDVVDAPLTELDLDGDGYVDCDGDGFTSSDAWSDSSVFGEPSVGWDCDTVDDTVFPGAEEVCDGQYNDCDNYSATEAPTDETDDDGDGWVECERDEDILWNPYDASIDEPNMWHGSEDNDCWCANAAECATALASGTVGDARCLDEDGQLCIPNDVDKDGQCDDTSSDGSLTPGFSAPAVDSPLTDCDDDDANTYPGSSPMEGNEAALANSTVMADVNPWLCMTDADGDFYGDSGVDTTTGITAGSDCDDSLVTVYPYQQESCESSDQIDDDCNGDINSADGFSTLDNWTEADNGYFYYDLDGDSFGDADAARVAGCEIYEGYSTNQRDCDDSDEDINPNAEEVCDGVDQNCNDKIDEPDLDPDTSGCETVYRDLDGDGYGDTDVSECLCLIGDAESVENPNDDNRTYVVTSGDCYDRDANIRPLSCADGSDNDGDGLADEEDPNCQNGENEEGTADEVALEVIDGHDNDCDGYVPLVELDCDDDGYMSMVPLEGSLSSDTSSSVFSYGYEYETYEDLGLAVCGNTPDEASSVTCWGSSVEIVCDAPTLVVDTSGGVQADGTGLWMLSYGSLSSDLESKFTGGFRTYESTRTLKTGDCDDQCDNRNPNEDEGCDQIDNNCSDTDPGSDDDGIPDALDPDVVIPGTISVAELDLDGDSFLSCDDLPSITSETQYSSNNCDNSVVVSEEDDCEILCSLVSPLGRDGEEACDGLANICNTDAEDGDPDTLDADRDDFRECGAWGSASSGIENEEIYAVVWLKDVDWARRGSDEVELARSVKSGGVATGTDDRVVTMADYDASVAELPPAEAGGDSGALAPPPSDSGLVLDTGDTGAFDTGSGDGGDDGSDEEEETSSSANAVLEDFIPLLLPRTNSAGEVIECDSELEEQLTLLLGGEDNDTSLGASRLEAALGSGNAREDARRTTSEILLEACQREDGFCSVVRLTLDDDVDETTYDDFVSQVGAFTGECEDLPEQWIARAMWQHDRILEARQTVIEWDCLRLYGEYCEELDSSSSLLVDSWDEGMQSADRWLDAVDTWWRELDRFDVATAHTETYLTCWGDPRVETDSISQETGGDCDDSTETGADANRDNPEGPDDLLGLYLGSPADCSTCLDGVDNNCDGNIDCADPACARCFIGQGVGCSRGDDPCAQAGCANGSPRGGAHLDRVFAAALVALFAVLYRRRERR